MTTKRHKKCKKNYFRSCFFCVFLWLNIFIFTGCAEQIRKPTKICPGKESVADVISVIESRTQSVVPFRANGKCRLEYYDDGKPRKENFTVKIWFNPVRSYSQEGTYTMSLTSNGVNPPAEVYLQGDIAFDPKGIVLGSNENEFWFAVRLKEVSRYWCGKWKETGHIDELIISPRLVLEAFGMAEFGRGQENCSLSQEGAFDVLSRRDDNGRLIRKIYIYNCDYSIRKIEYFDVNGKIRVTAELDKYKQLSEEFYIPMRIKITKYGKSAEDLTNVIVSLTSIRQYSFSQKQRNILFMPPKQSDYKHIYTNIDGKWIEQQ